MTLAEWVPVKSPKKGGKLYSGERHKFDRCFKKWTESCTPAEARRGDSCVTKDNKKIVCQYNNKGKPQWLTASKASGGQSAELMGLTVKGPPGGGQSKNRVRRSSELMGGVEVRTGGISNIIVTNNTGATIFVRIYKVRTQRAGSFVVGVDKAASGTPVEIENGQKAAVEYYGLTGFDRVSPSVNLYLYWSKNRADLIGNAPYNGSSGKFNTNTVHIRYTHNYVTISATGAVATTSAGGKKKKKGGNKSRVVPKWSA